MNIYEQMMEANRCDYNIIRGNNVDECVLLQFDGGSRGNPGKSAGGSILFDKNKKKIFEIGEYINKATNNQAEYTGLFIGVEKASNLGYKSIKIEGDSLLVVNQILGKWKINNAELRVLNNKIKEILNKFDNVLIKHIERKYNTQSDELANKVMDSCANYFKHYV